MKDYGEVHFRGLVLREAPDLDDPDLRQLNVLLTTRACANERDPFMHSFLEKHPDDYRIVYINARLKLMQRQPEMAHDLLEHAVQKHPEFGSGKVLLASMHIERGEFKEAQALLDQVAAQSPHDMWAFVERLMIEAVLLPSSDTWRQAEEIASNPTFPPTVREVAQMIAQRNPTSSENRLATATAPAQPAVRPVSAECGAARDFGDVHFRGQVLREAPDLDDPELRRLNVMLTTRCAERDALLQSFVEKHPDDYRIGFLQARLAWIHGDMNTAESMMTLALERHPDFSSAKVLLASIRLARLQTVGVPGQRQALIGEAQVLLDQLATESPHDMWAFVDRMKIEEEVSSSPDTYRKAEEILNNPAFPLTVREEAADLVLHDPHMTPSRLRAVYQTWTTFESQTPNWIKAENIAQRLIEYDAQYALGRQVLEQSLARPGDARGQLKLRTLLAESYLLEAAAINPAPSAENAQLVAKASATLNGDLTPVSDRISGRRDLAGLQPFVAAKTDFNAVDEYGRSVICNAVETGDYAMVQTALQGGADPNGQCEGRPLAEEAIHRGGEPPQKAQTVLVLLLDAGAMIDMPEAMRFCATPDGRFCKQHLLPILEKYRDRAGRR